MSIANVNKQSGAVLIVALVLLAVITLFGVANMQSSSMEMRMISVTMDRNRAFVAAEGALELAEAAVASSMNIDYDDLYTDTCTGDTCFTNPCSNNGRCFDGEFSNGDTEFDCTVAPNAGTVERVNFWEDTTVWSTDSRHTKVNVGNVEAKYIVEFLCFIDMTSSGTFSSAPANANDGEPLFRITAFVEHDRAPVMVQSTFVIQDF
jgi:type IV pilus assembly protein PilX